MTVFRKAASFRELQLLCAAAAGLFSVTAMIGSGLATENGWRDFDAGGVSFGAPVAMRAPANDPPTPETVDAARPDWSFTLTDQPDGAYRGTTISFDWSKNVVDEASGTHVLARGTTVVAGHHATRIDWRDGDVGWLGFDVVFQDVSPSGELLKVTCHSVESRWIAAKPLCECMDLYHISLIRTQVPTGVIRWT